MRRIMAMVGCVIIVLFVATMPADASILDVSQPRNIIAEGDDYTIEGTATDVKYVDYILVGPKGWKSRTKEAIVNGILKKSALVTRGEFNEEETMTDGLDLGVWVAVILSPSRDGEYDATGGGAGTLTLAGLEVKAGMSQTQILEIIADKITAAGSDDLMATLSFTVEPGYVRSNLVESVLVGKPLEISGVTNREPGTTIAISTLAGPTDLAAITAVEWPTASQGVFTATIDTTDAVEGTYILEADDGDGDTATVTVTIGEAAPTAPTAPPATPTPTAPPATAAPSPIPTVPTSTPSHQELLDEELTKLSSGSILFNPPKNMKVGVEKRVEVRITQTQNIMENFTEGLVGPGEPQIEPIKVGGFMAAKLTGENFEITPLSHEEQPVGLEGFTQWSWDVKPLRSGQQTLTLRVTVRVKIPNQDEETQDLPVLNKQINVEVNPPYTFKIFVENNWHGVIGLIISAIAAIPILLKLFRKPSS